MLKVQMFLFCSKQAEQLKWMVGKELLCDAGNMRTLLQPRFYVEYFLDRIIYMKKICPGCGEERDAEEDFNWRHEARRIRQTRCKFCQSLVSKRHYKKNKQLYIDRVRAREVWIIENNHRQLASYLSDHSCVDCGCANVRVLEFDHVCGEKLGDISRMVGEGFSWTTIEAEIAKCEVRCANCHRIMTSIKGGSWRHFFDLFLLDRARTPPARINAKNKQRLYAYLSEHACVDCGQADIRCLEFDHVRGDKVASITKMINGATSWKAIEDEI
ncbi:MAG: hypothetical protein ACJ8BW_11230, partial [Ktedonobacteraceae bacterium]